MQAKSNDKTRCSRSAHVIFLSFFYLLLVCSVLIARTTIQAFHFHVTTISFRNKAHIKAIKRALYINHQSNSILKVKSQPDDDDDQGDDDTPTNSQRRLARVRNRVTDLARKMVQVPIHVASSITPMPQAVAAVLKDATLNAVDLAVEEGMKSAMFCPSALPSSSHCFVANPVFLQQYFFTETEKIIHR
jgi:hypothetical protein